MDSDFESLLDIMNAFSRNVKRNLNLIRDLDQRSETISVSIDKSKDEYIESVNEFSLNQRNDYLNQINHLFDKTMGFTEDKLGLAEQTYHLVDKQLKQLNTYSDNLVKRLKDIEEEKERKKNEIKLKPIVRRVSKQKSTKVLKFTEICLKQRNDKNKNKKTNKRSEVKNVLIDVNIEEEVDLIRSRRSRRTKPIQKNRFNSDNFVFTPFKPRIVVPNSDQLVRKALKVEMIAKNDTKSEEPNPSELVFCVCKQISFGEMIECENKNCYNKWFHFGCVGLRQKPEGKWFCDKCGSNSVQ